VATVLLATASFAQAQLAKKIPRIGVLSAPAQAVIAARMEAFRRGLRELGYDEGVSLAIEYRYAEGKFERLPELAADLVRLKVDLIVAVGGGQAVRAAKNATTTIPIVMTGLVDPVSENVIVSLARPGGNITGLSLGGNELYGKRLELLKEAAPKASRIAFFWARNSPALPPYLSEIQSAASALSLQVQPHEVQNPKNLDEVLRTAVKAGAQAFTLSINPTFIGSRKTLLEFAVKNRLPAIYYAAEFVDDGGLMSYAPQFSDLYRRAATYVDKILKGANAAELPVEQPIKFDFVVNLKAGKQIGLTMPPNLLVRANRVIR